MVKSQSWTSGKPLDSTGNPDPKPSTSASPLALTHVSSTGTLTSMKGSKSDFGLKSKAEPATLKPEKTALKPAATSGSRTKVSVLESFDPLMRPDDDDDFMLRGQRQGSPGFET